MRSADWDDIGLADRPARRRAARAVRRAMADRAMEAMGPRTRSGRPYEEHRCAEMPYGYRIRRYGLPTNRFDTDMLPCFVWTIVRLEVPDYWIEGDECQGMALGTPGTEPCFCPWCGEPLRRLPDAIRGWRGSYGGEGVEP